MVGFLSYGIGSCLMIGFLSYDVDSCLMIFLSYGIFMFSISLDV